MTRLNKEELLYKIKLLKPYIKIGQNISFLLFMASVGVILFLSLNTAGVIGMLLSILIWEISSHLANMVKFDEIKVEIFEKK